LGTLPRASANAGEHGLTVRSFGHGEGEEGNVENWAIPLGVVQQGDNITIKASVPGVNPEDLDVSILRWAKTTQDKEDNIL
jgi:HSP20 family molecular chaperone IbpA